MSRNGTIHRSSPSPVGVPGLVVLLPSLSSVEVGTANLRSSSLIRSFDAVLLYPFQIYPFIGIFVSAYLKALGTGTHLHKPVRRRHHIIAFSIMLCSIGR